MKKPLIHATASIAISTILIASIAPPSSAEEGHEHPCKSEWRSEGDLTLENQLPVQLGPFIGNNVKPLRLGFEAVFSVAAPQGCPGFRYVHSQFTSTTVFLRYLKSNQGGEDPSVHGLEQESGTRFDTRTVPGNLVNPEWVFGQRHFYENTENTIFGDPNLFFEGSKTFKFEDAFVDLNLPAQYQYNQFITVKSLTAYASGEHHFEEVPGPLPLLGVAAGFSYCRKLRKRLKSNKLPVVSADD